MRTQPEHWDDVVHPVASPSGSPLVAAAGASGNGMITCLLSMERWIEHVRARKFDLIPVDRWSREYELVAIQEAARTMVQKTKP